MMADPFGRVTFQDAAGWTDAQLYDIVLRPRDREDEPVKKDEGVIDADALGSLPDTPENQLKAMLLLGGVIGEPREKTIGKWEAATGLKAADLGL